MFVRSKIELKQVRLLGSKNPMLNLLPAKIFLNALSKFIASTYNAYTLQI
jgi:hypothetical protein